MKFTVRVPIEKATGNQFFTVDAGSEDEAVAKFKNGEGEFEFEEIDVENLDYNGVTAWQEEDGGDQ